MDLVYASGDPWIVDDRVAPDKPLDSAVLSRLKQFSAMNKLKKMALRVCFIHFFLLLSSKLIFLIIKIFRQYSDSHLIEPVIDWIEF